MTHDYQKFRRHSRRERILGSDFWMSRPVFDHLNPQKCVKVGTQLGSTGSVPPSLLASHAKNIASCLYTKVRSDHPQLSRPVVEVEFDVIQIKSCDGITTPHLVARDKKTQSFIYLAEKEKTGEWITLGSEFHSRICKFAEHILRIFADQSDDGRASKTKLTLQTVATQEYQRFTQP